MAVTAVTSPIYLGNFGTGDDAFCWFNTTIDGVPATLVGGLPGSLRNGDSNPITSGITLTTDFGGITGVHLIRVDTADPAYSQQADYVVGLLAGTVGGVSLVGHLVCTFSLNHRARLVWSEIVRS